MSSVFFRIIIPSEAEEQHLRAQLVRKLQQEREQDSDVCMLLTKDEPVGEGPSPSSSGRSEPIAQRSSEAGLENAVNVGKKPDFPRSQTAEFITHFETATGRGICLNVEPDAPMEEILRATIAVYKIQNAFWRTDASGKMVEVTFTMPYGETYEKILDTLQRWGIGERIGSTVSVMNCHTSRCYTDAMPPEAAEYEAENSEEKKSAWDRFVNSVSARLNVAQIVRDLHQEASITFDFLVLLVAAAFVAAIGLVENSTIYLASSMLISPLMGPIIAAIFGTVIKQKSLYWIGMKNELIGIAGATAVGFICGLVVSLLDESYNFNLGITSEMLSRCEVRSLVMSTLTAIASGAAAAVGILGGNIGSLVGVAISASLLPPAVNSGLLWAIACVYKVFSMAGATGMHVIDTNRYSDDEATELAILASISMCLTIVNVLCIYGVGLLVLRIKEIAPIVLRINNTLWKHDVKVARNMANNDVDANEAAFMYRLHRYEGGLPRDPYETCPAAANESRSSAAHYWNNHTTVTDPEHHQYLPRVLNHSPQRFSTKNLRFSNNVKKSTYPANPFGFASPTRGGTTYDSSAEATALVSQPKRFQVTPAPDVPFTVRPDTVGDQ